MSTLLEQYVSAQGKLHARTEQERYGRERDSAHDLTDEEASITLRVLQCETGVIDTDTLSPEEQEVVRFHLQSETKEAD